MKNSTSAVVRSAIDSDRTALLDVLGRVYATSSDYPPHVDVDGSVGSLETWLFEDNPLARWVATVNGELVGHVLVHEPGQYLTRRYQDLSLDPDATWVEVGKLFADPQSSGRGVGSSLLTTARTNIIERGARLVLCVVETSEDAHRLYVREGLVTVGEFDGVHGRNIVMTG